MGELVKIKSNNPAHPNGYYVQFKERMQPGDVIFGGEEIAEPKKENVAKPIPQVSTQNKKGKK